MPNPIVALIAGGSQLVGGMIQSRAASKAAGAQQASAEAGIEEQRRQFDEISKLLKPYVGAGTTAIGQFAPYQEAGTTAFAQQQALAGLMGPEAQQAAIAQLEASPLLQSRIRLGEEALLQRASATGGLRGGNIQAALAQFRPQMLQQAIEEQYGRLGGIAGAGLGVTSQLYTGGQAAAARQALQAGATGTNIANLLAQQGAAQAGGILGQAAPFAQAAQIPGRLAGYQMATGQDIYGNLFGGGATPTLVPTGTTETPMWT